MANQPQAQVSEFARSYNSFSGIDIKAVFGNKVMGEIQAISYSITREKAPIYTMGSADPRSFSRGKRGIAGTAVFTMFDRDAILSELGGLSPDGGLKFLSDIDDVRPDYSTGGDDLTTGTGATNEVGNTVDEQESNIVGPADDQEVAKAWYVDQIPPFDVTLAAANEYGAMAVMRVYGVELLNEGYGVSIDDVMSEKQYTWVGRTIVPWQAIDPDFVPQIAPST